MELATDRVSCCIDHLEGVRAIAVNIHVVVAIRDASVTESALTDSGEIAVAFQSPHARTNQGIKNLSVDRAAYLSGVDPDYSLKDLYEAIANRNFIWPHAEYPLIPVGKLVLNHNPTNYFAEVEQIAFSPAHMVPGIEPSPDKMLQGRLFSYADTHRHRLGVNYHQIPVNCPYASKARNYQRDGPMTIDSNQGGAPNYFPNSFSGPLDHPSHALSKTVVTSGDAKRFNTADDDNFSQVGTFWRKVLSEEEKTRLVQNIAGHLKDATEFIQHRAVRKFTQADPDYGGRIAKLLQQYKRKTTAAHL